MNDETIWSNDQYRVIRFDGHGRLWTLGETSDGRPAASACMAAMAARISELEAELAAAQRALRLEQGRPAEGDLPPGWSRSLSGYSLEGLADVENDDLGNWVWAYDDEGTRREGDAASAAEAIDAAVAAMGGDA